MERRTYKKPFRKSSLTKMLQQNLKRIEHFISQNSLVINPPLFLTSNQNETKYQLIQTLYVIVCASRLWIGTVLPLPSRPIRYTVRAASVIHIVYM